MRKGQEEMVGFALVVVVLAVIGVVVLGFAAQNSRPALETTSPEIRTFLDSFVASTSTCTLGGAISPGTLGEMSIQCITRPDRRCGSGKTVCASLNSTIEELLSIYYPLTSEGRLEGYLLTLRQENASALFTFQRGTCQGEMQGDEVLLPGTRLITLTFTRCLRA
jgi:hypothetical protein